MATSEPFPVWKLAYRSTRARDFPQAPCLGTLSAKSQDFACEYLSPK